MAAQRFIGQERPFTREEHERLAQAIRAAEAGTTGEIVCVVARQSDSYFFPAATIALSFLLLASLGVALVAEHFWIALRPPLFVTAELLGAAALLLLLKILPGLRLALTPHSIRFKAARNQARQQFLARNIHLTTARTGVLLFVSLAERYAEVVADSGIHQRVSSETWEEIVAGITRRAAAGQLAEGLAEAVARAGNLLATHFPPARSDQNELDDHVVEI